MNTHYTFETIISMAIIIYLLIVCRKQKKELDYDELTNLISYSQFLKLANRMLIRASPGEYSLFFIDIDDFKYINKIIGVELSNQILVIFSDFMKTKVSKIDHNDYILTREVADKFIILCKTDENMDMRQVEKNLSELIKSELDINIELKYSIGQVVLNDTKKNILLYIGEARLANQRCKEYYNTHSEVLNSDMIEEFTLEKNILYRINQNLLNDSMKMFLQPKYDLKSGEIIGAEALVRWIENGEIVYTPDQFISVFEKYCFIKELDLHIFERACQVINELKRKNLNVIPISVNMSRITLMEDNIDKLLLDIMKKYNVDSQEIEVEITETALTADTEKVISQINKLKEVGFSISLDDFGSGQSSLTNLIYFEIDTIKLDREFLARNYEKSKMNIMIKHLINLMHEFDLKIVAEGVETIEDVKLLEKYGCDIAQGYYFSRPVPTDMFYSLI